MTILPRRLVKGDTIGIVSPASPFPAWFPRRFARSVSNLEAKGYKVKMGAHVRDKLGHKAGRKEERLEYDQEDDRPRSMKATTGWRALRAGHASGPLIGGEISTLVIQTGTEHMPSIDNSIFFWEDYGSSPAWVDRYLANLRTKGVFERIKGMLVGRMRTAGFEPTSTGYDVDNIILENTKGYDFPVMVNMDFGHTDPMMTLPIGVRATMHSEKGYLNID